jgi:membrane-associated protein
MIDFILHVDTHLLDLIQQYGTTTYAILFGIIFAETGLVVTPFLPGDSLLFAGGALSAAGALDVRVLSVVITTAAVLGDTVNYWVGSKVAHLFHLDAPDMRVHRYVKREHVQRAHEFFEKHGPRAVVLARFVPIVRTFLPFVAGGAAMTYRTFMVYNAVGAMLWTALCVGAGYLFGNIPVVKENFTLVVLGIVAVSVLPIVVEVLKTWGRRSSRSSSGEAQA